MLLQYHTRMRNIHDEYIQILQRCLSQPTELHNHNTKSEIPDISDNKDCGEQLAKEHIQNEIIAQMSEQDVIWDRIRKAQKNTESRPNNLVQTQPIKPELPEPVPEQKKNVVINKLHRYPRKKQEQILKNIFDKAVVNIERLHEISPIPENERSEMIQKEADTLLAQYLKKK